MDAPPVQYVKTTDNWSIAYAVSGEGAPLILMPPEFSHIETYWTESTFFLPWLQGLSERFRLVQYDGRGQGMSQRSLPDSLTDADLANDLEAVVDRCGFDRFYLVGSMWSVPQAVSYAVKHPEKVLGLVLSAGSVDSSDNPTVALETVARRDWRGFLLSQLPVGRAADVPHAIARLQQTITQEDWLKRIGALAQADLSELLPRVAVPTLVIHERDLYPLEASARLTAAIPNARMVHVDGPPPLGDAVPGLAAIDSFVEEVKATRWEATGSSSEAGLSVRELEVLRLLAAGKSNQQIADELVISLNTVRRHVSNIFDKTGVANRSQAAVYARDLGLV